MGLMSFFKGIGGLFKRLFSRAATSEALMQFVTDLTPVATKLVEGAVNMDLDGDGKRGYVKGELATYCKTKGIEYISRYGNLLIEMVYNELMEKKNG